MEVMNVTAKEVGAQDVSFPSVIHVNFVRSCLEEVTLNYT